MYNLLMKNIKKIFSNNKNKIKFNKDSDDITLDTNSKIPKIKFKLPPIFSSSKILRDKNIQKIIKPSLSIITGLYIYSKINTKKTRGGESSDMQALMVITTFIASFLQLKSTYYKPLPYQFYNQGNLGPYAGPIYPNNIDVPLTETDVFVD